MKTVYGRPSEKRAKRVRSEVFTMSDIITEMTLASLSEAYEPFTALSLLRQAFQTGEFGLVPRVLGKIPPPGHFTVKGEDFPNIPLEIPDPRLCMMLSTDEEGYRCDSASSGMKKVDALFVALESAQYKIVDRLLRYPGTVAKLKRLYGADLLNEGPAILYDYMLAAILPKPTTTGALPEESFPTIKQRSSCVKALLEAVPEVMGTHKRRKRYLYFTAISGMWRTFKYLLRWWCGTEAQLVDLVRTEGPSILRACSREFGTPCEEHSIHLHPYNLRRVHPQPPPESATTFGLGGWKPAPYTRGCSMCALKCISILLGYTRYPYLDERHVQVWKKEECVGYHSNIMAFRAEVCKRLAARREADRPY